MGKSTVSRSQSKGQKVPIFDGTIVEIADVRIICVVQNDVTGKLIRREISLSLEPSSSQKEVLHGSH